MANKKTKRIIQKSMLNKIVSTLRDNGVTKAGVFGSFARGEAKKRSDVDILIKFNGDLFDLAGLEIELEKKVGRKVDLITYASINPLLKKRIMGEEIRIL